MGVPLGITGNAVEEASRVAGATSVTDKVGVAFPLNIRPGLCWWG